MDLSTDYLGLTLRSPIVASAGPLTGRLDSLRALQDAGVAAVVLPSLFEEQVASSDRATFGLFALPPTGGDAPTYFGDLRGDETVAERYLRHVEDAKAALEIPVIASLNGVAAGRWARYAWFLQDAGADGVELNLSGVVVDPTASAATVEQEQLDLVARIAEILDVPLAVKLSPYYSAFGHLATRMVAAGARGLVLFNRLVQPDIDPDSGRVVSNLQLSTPAELPLALRWIALLHGRVAASLAATTGVHSGRDVAKALLAGADVVMMTSALLRHGCGHVGVVERELQHWADEHGYKSLREVRGRASHRNVADPFALERANYVAGLIDADALAAAPGTPPGRAAATAGG